MLHVDSNVIVNLTFDSSLLFMMQTAQLQIAIQNVVDHPQDAVCAQRVVELKQM